MEPRWQGLVRTEPVNRGFDLLNIKTHLSYPLFLFQPPCPIPLTIFVLSLTSPRRRPQQRPRLLQVASVLIISSRGHLLPQLLFPLVADPCLQVV